MASETATDTKQITLKTVLAVRVLALLLKDATEGWFGGFGFGGSTCRDLGRCFRLFAIWIHYMDSLFCIIANSNDAVATIRLTDISSNS